jgi:hypothetical protein
MGSQAPALFCLHISLHPLVTKMETPHRLLDLFVLGALVAAWFTPQFGSGLLRPIEEFGKRLASRKGLCICILGIAPAIIRLSLLLFLPVPVPHIGDEFSYLLAADTFAHGRLTNPPHPMWIYFDTFHVNQHPTYMSKYPPAQGVALAVGELLGHPWIGVILSVGLLCGAIVWMLQGWFPARWALIGGILAVLHLGISSSWVNSYWGGAVAATGGALVVGALPRIMRFHRPRDAVLLALGAAILANSRPFEGLIFCVPVSAAIVIWLCGRGGPPRHETAARIILPALAVLAFTALFMGYYNWRGTGSPFLFPYTVNNRTYITTPELVWEKPRAALHYLNPQFEAFYNGWLRSPGTVIRANSLPRAWRVLSSDARGYIGFFLWPELCVLLLSVPWLLTDRRTRFLVFQFIFCFLGFLLVVWFQAHYAAPLTATTFGLLTQGMRHLRRWRWRGRPGGIGLSRAIVVCALLVAPFHVSRSNPPEAENRARIAAQLDSMPGKHLILVRYSAQHNVQDEWVYNRAVIDRARTVWAREIPGISLEPLLNYFRGRDVWVVEPDKPNPRLSPYTPQSGQHP